MDPVTAVRVQAPLPATPPLPATDRLTSAAAAQTGQPVTAVMRHDAVRQAAVLAGTVAAHLAARDDSDHPAAEARAAAEAARRAYIQASRAAGVSPLPLPGV